VWLTVASVLLDTAGCGHIPVNHRLFAADPDHRRPRARSPTRFPGADDRRSARHQVADTVMKPLSQPCRARFRPGIGNLKVMPFPGCGRGALGPHEIFEAAMAARRLDGMDAVDTLYAIPATPIEISRATAAARDR